MNICEYLNENVTLPCTDQCNTESEAWDCCECLEIMPTGYLKIDTHTAVTDIPTVSEKCKIMGLSTREMYYLEKLLNMQTVVCDQSQEPFH